MRKRNSRLSRLELLESRRLLTIGFVTHELSPPDPSPEQFISFDIDRDGDIDVVSDLGDELVWFDNTDGQGSFSPPQRISTRYGLNFEIADLNGDGNEDILSGSKWLKGQGDGTFESLASLPVDSALSHTADLDGDGDLDVLLPDTEDSIMHWLENVDALGRFELRDSLQLPFSRTILLADLNNDALIDIIVPTENGAIWLPNSQTDGPFGSQRTMTLTEDRLEKLLAADWDLDGDTDLISLSKLNSGGLIQWHENDGSGTLASGAELFIEPFNNGPIDIHLGDIEQDGDMDILYEYNALNIPGLGAFSFVENATLGSIGEMTGLFPLPRGDYFGHLSLADVNGDDVLDAFFNSLAGLGWMNPAVAFERPPTFRISPESSGADRAGLEDVDGDGTPDISWIDRNETRRGWFAGEEGGTFADSQELDEDVSLPFVDARIYADLDNDGDLDVVNRFGGTIWYERDGQAYRERAIDGLTHEPFEYQVVDQDGDGDADLVALSPGSEVGRVNLTWIENEDGQGNFGAEQFVSETESPGNIFSIDVDLDGDFDIMTQDGTGWFEFKADGNFSERTSTRSVIGFSPSLALTDADNDGLAERVTAMNDGTITWERELPTALPFELRFGGRSRVDLDADGDIDQLVFTAGRMHWQQNVDGKLQRHEGTNSPVGLLVEDQYAFRWSFGDVDDDGDLDIISAGLGKVSWHENRLLGDTDDNGQVDFADFLAMSANFGSVDAGWEDGDFTGDEVVSFEDFLVLSANFGQGRSGPD